MNRVARILVPLLAAASARPLPAADAPYFTTYSHAMEEPGNLEIGITQLAGSPPGGRAFMSSLVEIEYGLAAWWTTEVYLAGQGTRGEGALFTGYRVENRVRPLAGEHWINPVLYVEFVHSNGADKSLREIVGHDGFEDQLEPVSESRRESKREIETRLILSSNVRGWNISENFIAEKNLAAEPWEFGYAVGVSRPLAMAAGPRPCTWCRENFRAGVEVFGGLGTRHDFGWRGTSHYLAPTLAWEMPGGATLRVSPAFGVNGNSHPWLLRFGVSYEISQVARLWRRDAR